MKVTRANGQYLYDDSGMEYLDCVNCVAHGKAGVFISPIYFFFVIILSLHE